MSGHRPGLDETAHGCSVSEQRPVLGESRVSVSVEVDECDLAKAVSPRDAQRVWPGDRVVTAQDDRHLAGPGDVCNDVSDSLDGDLQLPGSDIDVTDVDHPKSLEWVYAGWEVGPVAVHGSVVGVPDRIGAEPRSGPIRGSPIERRAQDYDIAITHVVHGYRRAAEEGVAGGE